MNAFNTMRSLFEKAKMYDVRMMMMMMMMMVVMRQIRRKKLKRWRTM